MTTIGVLALQGAFVEHERRLHELGVATRQVRLPVDLDGLVGLIIPGGESTTIGKLLESFDLSTPIREAVRNGLAVWGTCAGAILLSREIVGSDQPTLGLVDASIRRNAFGRQIDSFEADLQMVRVSARPVHAVFIRAPVIERVGPRVEVLGRLETGQIVAAQQDRLLLTAFHPELTSDPAVHRYFLELCAAQTPATPLVGATGA